MATTLQRVNRSPSCLVLGGVFGDVGSNGAISGLVKFKMAAGGHFEKLQMAISQQHVIGSTLCLVHGLGFRRRRMELCYAGWVH